MNKQMKTSKARGDLSVCWQKEVQNGSFLIMNCFWGLFPSPGNRFPRGLCAWGVAFLSRRPVHPSAGLFFKDKKLQTNPSSSNWSIVSKGINYPLFLSVLHCTNGRLSPLQHKKMSCWSARKISRRKNKKVMQKNGIKGLRIRIFPITLPCPQSMHN